MPTTLKMLAAELGISPAAVSMALRNHPRISLNLRQKARALAKKRNYVPNPAYSRNGGWRSRKARAAMPLALVYQNHPVTGHGVSTYISTLAKVASAFGYELQSHLCEHGRADRVGDILYARGVEAVIIGRIFDPQFNKQFPWERFSVVALDVGYVRPPCHLVMPDIAGATFEAVRRALKRGCRRIGLYEFREMAPPVDWADRFGAAAAAQQLCKSQGAQLLRTEGPAYDAESFFQWVKKKRPDIVLGQTPACFWWLKEMAAESPPIPSISLQMDPAEKMHGVCGFVHDNEALTTVAVKLLDAEVRNFEKGKPRFPTRQLVSMPLHEGLQENVAR